MVKMAIVSEYSLDPPADGRGRVKIAGGPLYDLARVQALAASGDLLAWTDRCDKTIYDLFGGDLGEVATLLASAQASDYRDSEWCTNGRGQWAACDSYSVRRTEWVHAAGKQMPMAYFLKFAVGKTGQLVLLVSCHV